MVVPPGRDEAIGQEVVSGLLQIVEIPDHTYGQWEGLLTKARISAVLDQVDRACWDSETRRELGNLAKDEVLAALQHLLGRKCAHLVSKENPDRTTYREVL